MCLLERACCESRGRKALVLFASGRAREITRDPNAIRDPMPDIRPTTYAAAFARPWSGARRSCQGSVTVVDNWLTGTMLFDMSINSLHHCYLTHTAPMS